MERNKGINKRKLFVKTIVDGLGTSVGLEIFLFTLHSLFLMVELLYFMMGVLSLLLVLLVLLLLLLLFWSLLNCWNNRIYSSYCWVWISPLLWSPYLIFSTSCSEAQPNYLFIIRRIIIMGRMIQVIIIIINPIRTLLIENRRQIHHSVSSIPFCLLI